jgi:hypothetical protein
MPSPYLFLARRRKSHEHDDAGHLQSALIGAPTKPAPRVPRLSDGGATLITVAVCCLAVFAATGLAAGVLSGVLTR